MQLYRMFFPAVQQSFEFSLLKNVRRTYMIQLEISSFGQKFGRIRDMN